MGEENACNVLYTLDVNKKVKKTRVKMSSTDPKLLKPVEKCFGSSLENHAVTVEVGLVEIIIRGWEGPITIGRFNTIAVEDAQSDILDCFMAELQTYFVEESVMPYPEFLL